MAEKKPESKKEAPKKPAAQEKGQKRKKVPLKKKPKKKFTVPNSTGKRRMKSVKPRWRRQTGIDNKKRIRKAFMGKSPRIGNKNAAEVRGMHPLGLPELLVNNAKELEGAENVLVRIASKVGKRKRAEIVSKAKEMNLRVLNEGVKK
ncbi:50S ribosomal protein L32e [Candidatus Micrarchaeota archaeon]|nr:50S ribosomal protein L32e [Candidatus Micrarchaeota archaeon]MBD3418285.1 50S ribosomal protein L32e [Candidatus Micrarchaeota archaeon]